MMLFNNIKKKIFDNYTYTKIVQYLKYVPVHISW